MPLEYFILPAEKITCNATVVFSVARRCFPISLFLIFTVFFSGFSYADNSSYLAQLHQQAIKLKLSEQREWHVLLHYSPRYFSSGVVSLVDNKTFFFHQQGKFNPQAELTATLTSFFQANKDANTSSQCLFPARFAWLRKQLTLDVSRLPKPDCEQLDYWLQRLAVTGISLIFPVSYLNNPASMFGHTFLRLDSRRNNGDADLLAWTVNYAANTDQEKGISFAFKGLFGGYPGRFSLAPYYFQVQSYSDVENRDIWEYQLNFTAAEIKALLLHLWELLPAHFDYFFVDENCSFQLLSLLEAARPELRLSELFQRDAIPADTVKAIVAVPGLLKNSKFRPSLRTTLLVRARQMPEQDQQLAMSLIENRLESKHTQLKMLSEWRQAQVLSLAFEYQAYADAELFANKLSEDTQQLAYELLLARNGLSVAAQTPTIESPAIRPDQGHKGNRLRLQYGYEDPGHFIDLQFRWAYHDLYDPAGGFIEGAKLEFFKPSVRYYLQSQKFQFEAIDLVNITSTPTYNSLLTPVSWKASAAVDRQRFNDDDRPLMASFRGGLGMSYELTAGTKITAFALSSIHISDRFEQFIAMGGGAEMYLLHEFTNAWRIGVKANVVQYFQGIVHTRYQFSIKQRFSINQDNALVLNLSHENEFSRTGFFVSELAWRYYF